MNTSTGTQLDIQFFLFKKYALMSFLFGDKLISILSAINNLINDHARLRDTCKFTSKEVAAELRVSLHQKRWQLSYV